MTRAALTCAGLALEALGLAFGLLSWTPAHGQPAGGSQRRLRVFSLPTNAQFMGAAFSPDGQTVAVEFAKDVSTPDETKWEHSEELQLWDFRSGKVTGKARLGHTFLEQHRAHKRLQVWGANSRYLRYSQDGRRIVVFDGKALHVVNTAELSDSQTIDLGIMRGTDPPTFLVAGMEITPHAHRAAVLLARPILGGGEVRVYDLDTRRLLQVWNSPQGGAFESAFIAWSPDENRLALTWRPASVSPSTELPSDVKNLLVLDANTGQVVTQINTGYVAGSVAFGPNNMILTVSANVNNHRFREDTIKIWDAVTGKLVRQIANPPDGIHYQLALSADGRVVVGYIGLEKYNPAVHFSEDVYSKFRLWDVATGEVIATSDPIPDLPHNVGRASGVSNSRYSGLQLALDAQGKHVLVWWLYPIVPSLVYELE
jgi:WD40 repeat protein